MEIIMSKKNLAVVETNETSVIENTNGTNETNETTVVETVETVSQPTHNIDELKKTYTTKSSLIRYLDSQGLKRGAIAKLLDIRYQHVRNVLITPLKKVD